MTATPYQCAPEVARPTLAAIVHVESGGNPLALHDNTTGSSYKPASLPEARALLESLLRLGHSVDAGLMQVNSSNFPRFGLTPASVFTPCVNINVGGDILRSAWSSAVHAGLQGQNALWHAVQAYNSGNLHGAPAYANRVWAAAGHARSPVPYSLSIRQVDKTVAFAQSWSARSGWNPR